MSGYNFGKSFTYELHINDADSAELDLTNAVFESAYVYDDSKPTREDAVAGTGSEQTISGWTIPSGKKYAELSVGVIDDPEPEGNFQRWSYWIVVNFRFSAGEQIQTMLKELPIERITAQQSGIDVTSADILKHFPTLTRYFSNLNDITNLIEVTEEEIKAYLSGQGFEWAKIWHPKALHTAVKFKTLSNICLMQSIDSGDEWEVKYNEYQSLYTSVIDSTKLEFDTHKQGEITETESKSSWQRFIR